MYVCMYVRRYVCMYVCMHACMYVRVCSCMFVHVRVCLCININICIYICIYVYIYIYTHTYCNEGMELVYISIKSLLCGLQIRTPDGTSATYTGDREIDGNRLASSGDCDRS